MELVGLKPKTRYLIPGISLLITLLMASSFCGHFNQWRGTIVDWIILGISVVVMAGFWGFMTLLHRSLSRRSLHIEKDVLIIRSGFHEEHVKLSSIADITIWKPDEGPASYLKVGGTCLPGYAGGHFRGDDNHTYFVDFVSRPNLCIHRGPHADRIALQVTDPEAMKSRLAMASPQLRMRALDTPARDTPCPDPAP